MNNGEPFIVKTGECDPTNHSTAIVLALEMGKSVNQGIKEVLSNLEAQEKEQKAQGKTLLTINAHIKGITDWQDEHDKRIDQEKEFEEKLKEATLAAAKAKAEEKKRFWASGWGTAAKAVISVSVVAVVGFFSSIFGGGLAEWAKTWLAK